jgi:iron complex outermembrane receptor protein
VLRGPQGTLFGKNSPAGAISLRTKRPTGELGGKVSLDYGRFDRVEARGLVDLPITDTLAANLMGSYRRGGGYYANKSTGETMGDADVFAIRGGLLWSPSDETSWYVTADYRQNRSEQPGGRNVSVPFDRGTFNPMPAICQLALLGVYPADACVPNKRRFTTHADFTAKYDIEHYSITSDLNVGLGPVTLASLTGYKDSKNIDNQDVDQTPQQVLHGVDVRLDNEQFSQELRLSSVKGAGWDLNERIDWVVGLFYSKNDYDLHQPLVILNPIVGNVLNRQSGGVTSKAVFGHVITNITDQWNVSVGARQTWDKREHDYIPPGFTEADRTFEEVKFDEFTFEIGTEYKLAPDKAVYVRFAQGYRGGGFTGVPSVPNAGLFFAPETVDSYEAGLKSDWLDGTLRVNLYAFYNEWSDLQRYGTVPSPTSGFLQVIINAADATTKGVELESLYQVTDNLLLRASLGTLKADYDRYLADVLSIGTPQDLSDFRFPFAPKFTANVSATYTQYLAAGKLSYDLMFDYRSSFLASNTVDEPHFSEGGFGLFNAGIRFDSASGRYSIGLYGRNLFDKEYVQEYQQAGGLVTIAADGMPRTWGMNLTVNF